MLDGLVSLASALATPRGDSKPPKRPRPGGGIPWPNPATDLGLYMTDRRTRIQLSAYKGWVYKAVTVIANRMAEIPFKVENIITQKDGSKEHIPVPVHPIYELLDDGSGSRPNPMVTAQHLRKLTVMDLELTGNAFWYKVRDRTGTPRELWRLRPDKLSPVFDKETMSLKGWAWMSATGYSLKSVAFLAEDVVHFMYPSPFGDPFLGTSPLRAADYAYDIDEAHKKYQRHFFDHGAQLSLVLSTEQDISPEVAENVLEDFMARYAGVENSWLPVVLGGGLKATPIAAANRELEAVKLMDFSRDDILSTFAVPKTKLGLAEQVNRASADALDVSFNRECINPKLRMMEAQLGADLLVDYPKPGTGHLKVTFDNPVPEDRDFLLTETTELHAAGLLTGNEARQRHKIKEWDGSYGEQVQVAMGVTMVDPDAVTEPGGEEPGEPKPGEGEVPGAEEGSEPTAEDLAAYEKKALALYDKRRAK